MRIKKIQLELTLVEFEVLLKHLQGRCVNQHLVSIFEKMYTIQQRIETAKKLSEKFPIREG